MIGLLFKIGILFLALLISIFVYAKRDVLKVSRTYFFSFQFFFVFIFIFVFKICVLFYFNNYTSFGFPADIGGYHQFACAVNEGMIPNKDFSTTYGVGFVYLLGLANIFYNHPFSIVLFFQIFEFIGVCLFCYIFGRFYKCNPQQILVFLLLYSFNPLAVMSLWLNGQDESMQVFFLGVTLLFDFILPGVLFGVYLAFVPFFTKIFSFWFCLPFVLNSSSRVYVFFVFNILVILVLYFFGVKYFNFENKVQGGISHDLTNFITPGNFWYFFENINFFTISVWTLRIICLIGICICCCFCFYVKKYFKDLQFFYLWSAALLSGVFQLLSPMVFPPYLFSWLLFSLFLLVIYNDGKFFLLFTAWSFFATIEPTIWYRLKIYEVENTPLFTLVSFLCLDFIVDFLTLLFFIKLFLLPFSFSNYKYGNC